MSRLPEPLPAAALRRLAAARAGRAPIPPRPPGQPVPLTPVQRRLWFLDRAGLGGDTYLTWWAHRLTGPLDPAALERSLRVVLDRHELLRAGIAAEGAAGPVWQAPTVVDRLDPAGWLERVDLSDLPPESREPAARVRVDTFLHRGFDLARPPLLRAMLVRLDPRDHVLALCAHHIVCDATASGVIADDLYEHYRGREPAAPGVGFLDYAAWLAGRAELAADRDYWRTHLAGAPPLLRLPFDHPVPARPSRAGARHLELLPADLTGQVRALARRERATFFSVLLATFAGVLVRFGADEDLVVGAPAYTRDRPELERTVGMFANTLALRTDLGGDPALSAVLRRAAGAVAGGLGHATFPFEEVVELASTPGSRRDLRRNPLCQVMLVVAGADQDRTAAPGLRATGWALPQPPARFDLTLLVVTGAEQLELHLDYPVELFEPATVARLGTALHRMLVALVTDPGQRLSEVPLVTPARGAPPLSAHPTPTTPPEASMLVTPVRGEPVPPPVTELVARQAAARPDAPALVTDAEVLSYRELLDRADRLAGRLREVGVGPGGPVGVLLPTGVDAVTAILAVLRAGAAYLPLDPSHPAERVEAILAEAGAAVVVTAAGVERRDAAGGMPHAARSVRPADPAYVIYTSGSTGRPKGVVVTHRTLARLTRAFVDEHQLGPGTRLLMLPPVTFDASVGDLFPALASGAALVLHPEPARLDGPELVRFTTAHRVTAVDTAVALWRRWVDDLAAAPPPPDWPVTTMMVGGERVPAEAVRAWDATTGGRVTLFNHYGPTEATVCATVHRAGADPTGDAAHLPIGRPLPHVRAYLLDRYGGLAPVGVVGELFLGGDCLADGYLGQPALTAQRFLPDPHAPEPGGRRYRTGDLARLRDDGQLEFHGRVDRQVKVLGHRVEPAEVEAALLAHPRVGDAVVTADRSRLVAYLAGVGEVPADLRGFLRRRLPDYLVPTAFVAVDRIPRTAHGKVDEEALPEPPLPGPRADAPPPQGPVETALAQVWARALGVPRVGRTDNFFDLGGHSLLAATVMSEVERRLGVALPLPVLFETADLAELAAVVAGAGDGWAGDPVNLPAEAVLPESIRPAAPAGPPARPPRAVLVTGATGFLGAHLVAQLLARTPATVWCLARAADPAAATARVREAMARFGAGEPGPGGRDADRIVGVPGDLTAPRLGLTEAELADLAGRVDLICHNGGVVNFVHPYRLLRPANVDGTVEVLRLAARRCVPVHFVSTLGVFLADAYRYGAVGEQDPPDDPTGLVDGYNQSKWVADAIARQARARGLPVSVHRPARIGAHSRTGRGNPDDWFCRLLATCVRVGMVPDLPQHEDISPVDYVAAGIAHLAATGTGPGADHHYFNRAMISYPEIAATLADRGHEAELVGWPRWRAAVLARIVAGDDLPLAPLAGWLTEQVPRFVRPEFDCSGTERALAQAGITCPPADRVLLGRLVDHLAALGQLWRTAGGDGR